ncbi:uncharacterized protein N7458_003803 [Penicillium daleae]|uniref:Clr5 domain-containing protein n=1 Tax=Penicillium daleae TaxID=63821 RepID=A0AAD6C9S1_9EURO|nr:uncharacterized protein N7458_003803 [Penicillium daleae]KAJ5455539.1 hypothetical protein N7458_003803 [Penicillium daleae]
MERARAYEGHRRVVFRLFVTEDLTREQAKLAFEEQALELRLTIHQWKTLLRDLGIFKNIRGQDAVRAKTILDQTLDGHHCLVFADGVLQENEEIVRHCDRRQDSPKEKSDPRKLTWIRLPFEVTTLSDPTAFKNFQYLLFTTRVHFESCFDTGEWAPNHKGLYARSTELKAQLAGLSRLHNMVFRALKQLKVGGNQRAEALLRSAFALHRSVVGYRHHRQLPDILGILLMVKRAGNEELQHFITTDLVSMARQVLPQNDPRRLMLEFLEMIDWEQLCPLYIAFDSYCRFLWMNRAGTDHVKAYFSYNQARFPRADAGEFYSLYKGLSIFEIENMLDRIDIELGKYSHETMTLWHTAMEYLWSEREYVEMGYICQRLSERVRRLGRRFDYSQDPQLNHDVSTTFLLLGLAQEAQGYPCTARLSFKQAAQVRDSIVPGDQWDAAREGALSKWVEVDRRIGELHKANTNSMLIDMMYTAI